jgi:7,8-dihydropterin-6-yl-methyl-4-(beta-D-ribofuranosyl)aminobenzene 5'-phosphate synthase
MAVRLTVLCENSVGRPNGTIGEHGFACLVETPGGNLLFDTGSGAGILNNAKVLDRDLTAISRIVLSHGHYDHTGGLPAVLALSGPVDIVAHPGIFGERYWVGDYERRAIGLPFQRSQVEARGARFDLRRDFSEVVPGVHFTGEIPRTTPFETGDPHLMAPVGDSLIPDPLLDDASLVIATDKGLVLLLGCAHAGVVNILRHVAARTGQGRIHALLGGTHLAPANDAQFAGTVRALHEFGVEKIGVGHCTGLPRAAQLYCEFGGRLSFASVGTVLEF